MADNAPASQVYSGGNFPHGGGPSYNGLNNPHGPGMIRPGGNYLNEQYLQYSQGGIRPGHPGTLAMSKGARGSTPGRPGPIWGPMNCSPNQQRYMPPGMMGPSQAEAPSTLNQLLQNNDQRYPSGVQCNDYNMMQKMNSNDMGGPPPGFGGPPGFNGPPGLGSPPGFGGQPGYGGMQQGYSIQQRQAMNAYHQQQQQQSMISGQSQPPQSMPGKQQFSPNHLAQSSSSHVQLSPRSSTPQSQHSDHTTQNAAPPPASKSKPKTKKKKVPTATLR